MAQIQECTGVRTEPGFKILRDEITPDEAAPPTSAVAHMTQRLHAKLAMDLGQFELTRGALVKIVPCPNRRPNFTDFNAPRVDQLNLHQVLIEVWGVVEAEKQGGVKGYVASARYLLMPARVNELQGKPPRSLYQSEVRQPADATADEVERVFTGQSQLGLLASVAAAMASFRAGNYDDAFSYGCQGELMLEKIRSPKPPEEDLLNYTRGLTNQIFQTARQDSGYNGWMKGLAKYSPCGAGGR